MRKVTPIGFLIILIFAFAGSGIAGITSFVSAIWQVIKAMIKWVSMVIIAFPEELGLIDAAYTWAFYLTICILCLAAGIYLNKKQKKKIYSIISFLVSAISFLFSILSGTSSK